MIVYIFLFVCFIFICFGLILLFIINVKEFKKLYQFVLIFLFIVVIIFVITKDSDLNYQVDKNVLKFYNSYVKQDISVPTDYIIVVGDSRMKYLSLDENVTLPVNMKFIAKPGAGFDWFVNTAIKELTLALDNKVENRFYSVVFNMGVNDLNYKEACIGKINDEGEAEIIPLKNVFWAKNALSAFSDEKCLNCKLLPDCYGGCILQKCKTCKKACRPFEMVSMLHIFR